jgi:hypothetical protein
MTDWQVNSPSAWRGAAFHRLSQKPAFGILRFPGVSVRSQTAPFRALREFDRNLSFAICHFPVPAPSL